ncbi:magnesium transporter [Palleronia marisminoris]|uniref:Magnesium transporter MgtE n=1 Tax=Palleronia marisminoris TaxID=315423 RepID=A0A1Y5RIF9_9RHOB|nr:magnesium transporter [Palleronia marisminoris]SFG23295.1 magnesium transporter [Palleronia marisminoris]SLN18306.1 Magnesium transporter MgtE [Palleronia marisminoris]
MAEPEEIIEPDDDAYAIDRGTMREVRDAVEAEDRDALLLAMEPMHPADVADLLEQLDEGPRHRLIALLGHDFDGEILSELDEGLREDVIEALSPAVLTEAVRGLNSDDVVDLLETLETPQQETILQALERPDRIAIERAMSFPEGSAGRLMQREVVTAPEHWTVGDAIDFMRASLDLPEQFYHIVLVDPRYQPIGQVTLGRVMSSDRVTKLKDLTEDSYRTIPATQDEEDVAYAFNQYHLISAPVVDDDGRLVGVITIDDAMIVLSQQNEEDLLLLAGVGDESIADRTLQIVRQRFPWLLVNLGTAILASMVIAQFEDVLAAIVALAVLMPIVASMGGNAGTQSMAVAVRALATRDLTGSNAWRVVRREVMAGFLNGAVFAIIIGIVGMIWFGNPMLGVVIAMAMIINLVVAGLAGVLLPILLDKAGVDPALASGTFVTTVTDVVGFFAFLGLAGLILL